MTHSGLTPDGRLLRQTAILTAIGTAAFGALALLSYIAGERFVMAIETANTTARASKLDQDGRLRASAAEYYRLLELSPGLHDVRALLVGVVLRQGLDGEALAQARILCGPDGDSSNPWYRSVLGDALAANDLWDEAEESYGAALELRPGFPDAVYGMALWSAFRGRREESEAYFEQLRSADLTAASSEYLGHLGSFQEQGPEGGHATERAETLRSIEWHLKHGRVDEARDLRRGLPKATGADSREIAALDRLDARETP